MGSRVKITIEGVEGSQSTWAPELMKALGEKLGVHGGTHDHSEGDSVFKAEREIVAVGEVVYQSQVDRLLRDISNVLNRRK